MKAYILPLASCFVGIGLLAFRYAVWNSGVTPWLTIPAALMLTLFGLFFLILGGVAIWNLLRAMPKNSKP